MSVLLYRRGKGVRRRVMHVAKYGPHGNIVGTWCGFADYNTAINVPLGRPICKQCKRKMQEEA